MSESFGKVLARVRRAYGVSQKDLSSEGRTASMVGLIEAGKRGISGIDNESLWQIAKRISEDCHVYDELFEAAGRSIIRADAEEQFYQASDRVQEVWVYAHTILDTNPGWLEVVKTNLRRGVKYFYVTRSVDRFRDLKNKVGPPANKGLQAVVVKNDPFLLNLAIYNPGRDTMWGCGTMRQYGVAKKFFTLDDATTIQGYEVLDRLKYQIGGQDWVHADHL